MSTTFSISTLIPDDTDPTTLQRLRVRYTELGDCVPAWYVAAILRRIDSLLAIQREAA